MGVGSKVAVAGWVTTAEALGVKVGSGCVGVGPVAVGVSVTVGVGLGPSVGSAVSVAVGRLVGKGVEVTGNAKS